MEHITMQTTSLLEAVRRHAAEMPDKLALVAPSGEGGTVRLTYGALAAQAERLARGLAAQGVRAGDRVGLHLGNPCAAEVVTAQLACAHLGAIAAHISPAYKPDELLYVVNLTGCKVIIRSSLNSDMIEALRGQFDSLQQIIEIGAEPPPGALRWRDCLLDGAPLTDLPGQGDPGFIIYTSGTTGRPKAVLLSQGNVVAGARARNLGWGTRSDDIIQSPLPMTSSAGVIVVVAASLLAGSTLIIEPKFDTDELFQRVKHEGTTVLIVVPAIIGFMLDQFDADRHSVGAVRLICYGAAPMTVANIQKTQDTFRGVELRQIYSMTESSTVGSYMDFENLLVKLGSVGRPQLTEIEIMDADDRPLPRHSVGEIVMRGPGIMLGYHADPEATTAAIRDGWLHTGDVGYLDDDGFLYVVDRMKDIIVRGGNNVGSVEVENTLVSHPSVLEAAVVAVPHQKLGEDVFAFVVARAGRNISVDALQAYCKERLSDYKVPRHIEVVNRLPRNLAGKVLKRELKDEAAKLIGEAGR